VDQYYYGRLGWLPTLEKGAAHETFDRIDGRLLQFSTRKGAEGTPPANKIAQTKYKHNNQTIRSIN
jgi:hypothetical protein